VLEDGNALLAKFLLAPVLPPVLAAAGCVSVRPEALLSTAD
jgi:hypothetical protein